MNCSDICALALTVPEFARAQDCVVRIYGYDDDYLEATVDTRSIGSNLFLENVSFEVTVRIKGTDKKATFDFTDTDHRSLWAGRVYQRYIAPFPSGIPLQVEVGAGSCECSKVLSWAKSDSLWAGRTIVNASRYVETIRPLLEEFSETYRPDLDPESDKC